MEAVQAVKISANFPSDGFSLLFCFDLSLFPAYSFPAVIFLSLFVVV